MSVFRRTLPSKRLPRALVLALFAPLALPAAEVTATDAVPVAEASAPDLKPVVVTATRVDQTAFDLPLSIDRLNKEQLQDGRLQINLAESMGRVPGIVVNNRSYLAGDVDGRRS